MVAMKSTDMSLKTNKHNLNNILNKTVPFTLLWNVE